MALTLVVETAKSSEPRVQNLAASLAAIELRVKMARSSDDDD